VDPAVEEHGRVHAERQPAGRVDGARLPFSMPEDELRGVGVGRIVLDVRGRDDVEGDAQLLEDRAALRARRCERQDGLRAVQISSTGQLRAQSAVTKE
jgi:hypothetical protein